MTERHGELTKYLVFKLDKYVTLLAPHLRDVLVEIIKEPEGITFEDLLMRVSYKGGFMGPRLLRASLKHLFDRDYIITNHQIVKLQKKQGIDVSKLRRVEVRTIKYFGVHGLLGGYLPGIYIVEANNIGAARSRLHDKTIRTGRGWYDEPELQEIRGEWVPALRDTLDHIRNREKKYYTDLGNGVYYVEI